MSQCENDNCDNCDDECGGDATMDEGSGVRTVFLKHAPDGAYSPEFAAYVESVWPEKDEFEMSIETALLTTKWLLLQDEPHLVEDAMNILSMMICHAMDAVDEEELVDLMMMYGLTVHDGMLALAE